MYIIFEQWWERARAREREREGERAIIHEIHTPKQKEHTRSMGPVGARRCTLKAPFSVHARLFLGRTNVRHHSRIYRTFGTSSGRYSLIIKTSPRACSHRQFFYIKKHLTRAVFYQLKNWQGGFVKLILEQNVLEPTLPIGYRIKVVWLRYSVSYNVEDEKISPCFGVRWQRRG